MSKKHFVGMDVFMNAEISGSRGGWVVCAVHLPGQEDVCA